MSITPDTKDWTWVLERPCPECGFDPTAQGLGDLPRLVHDTAKVWSEVLARGDVDRRPAPGVWSPLEYGCHVRDVHVLFAERLGSMLDEDEPTFANWDQDATALASDYRGQDATVVAAELVEAADTVAAIYATVTDATKDGRACGPTATASPSSRSAATTSTTSSTTCTTWGERWVMPSANRSRLRPRRGGVRRRTQVPDGVRADLSRRRPRRGRPGAGDRVGWRPRRAPDGGARTARAPHRHHPPSSRFSSRDTPATSSTRSRRPVLTGRSLRRRVGQCVAPARPARRPAGRPCRARQGDASGRPAQDLAQGG